MSPYTSFTCGSCHTEIQTTLDMIGLETECPACGAKIVIPDSDDESVVRHAAWDDDPESLQAMKSRTIRIDLEDI